MTWGPAQVTVETGSVEGDGLGRRVVIVLDELTGRDGDLDTRRSCY